MEDQDNINEHVKAKLEDYRLNPRITSFEEIQKKMKQKKRRGFLFFLIPGVFLFLSVAGYLFFTNKQTSPMASVSESAGYLPTTGNLNLNASEQTERTKDEKETKETFPKKINNKTPEPSERKSNLETKLPAEKLKTEIKSDGNSNQKKSSQKIVSQHVLSVGITSVPKKKKTEKVGSKTISSHTEPETARYKAAGKEIKDPDQTEPLQNAPERLELLDLPLKYERTLRSMRIDSVRQIPMAKSLNDSIKKEKNVHFFIGAAINPQMGAYLVKKKNGDEKEQPVFDAYYKAVKSENTLLFNYAYGLKGGVLIQNKWEVLAGFGLQKYAQKSRAVVIPIQQYTSPNLSPSNPQVQNTNNTADPDNTYKTTYKYYDFSAEVARLCTINRFLKVKFGLGWHAQKLRVRSRFFSPEINTNTAQYDSFNLYHQSQLNPWLGDVSLKAGLIEELTKNIQFQFCPNVFYSPKSMFGKGAYVNQKNYGFGLECLLLFRLR